MRWQWQVERSLLVDWVVRAGDAKPDKLRGRQP